MESTSNLFFKSQVKESQFFIQSDQDGLFFGKEFLQNFLQSSLKDLDYNLVTYFQDGDCILKNQTLFCINLKSSIKNNQTNPISEQNNILKQTNSITEHSNILKQTNSSEKNNISVINPVSKKNKNLANPCFKTTVKDLMAIVSYFSGLYTLISCWTKKGFDFSVIANPTPGFSFSGWEQIAIKKAGALVKKLPEVIYYTSKECYQAIQKNQKDILLSNLKMSQTEIKNLLDSLPPTTQLSLVGDFKPNDLEEFREFNLKFVYPTMLQGYFPSLKTKIRL